MPKLHWVGSSQQEEKQIRTNEFQPFIWQLNFFIDLFIDFPPFFSPILFTDFSTDFMLMFQSVDSTTTIVAGEAN